MKKKYRWMDYTTLTWYEGIPKVSMLTNGPTYALEQTVRDKEGAWSKPFRKDFTYSERAEFPLTVTLKARASKPMYQVPGVPKNEDILIYDLEVRYTDEISKVDLSLTNGTWYYARSFVNSTIEYIEGTSGTMRREDNLYIYEFNNVELTVPPEVTNDQNYYIRAIGTAKDRKTGRSTVPINLYTPIWEDYRGGTMNKIPGAIQLDDIKLTKNNLDNPQKNKLTFKVFKHTSKIAVTMENSTGSNDYFVLDQNKNDWISTNYQVTDIEIRENGDNKVFTCNLSVLEDYWHRDKATGTMVATGYFQGGSDRANYNPMRVPFKLIGNTPPVVAITEVKPDRIYEGDNIVTTVAVGDQDLDDLRLTVNLLDGSQVIWTDTMTIEPIGGRYETPTISIPSQMAKDYEIVAILEDGNGGEDTDRQVITVHPFKIEDVKLWGARSYWNGEVNILGQLKPIMPHRFMSWECVFLEFNTTTQPDEVEIRMSPQLEAMYYRNDYGHEYYHSEMIGYEVRFPFYWRKDGQTNNMKLKEVQGDQHKFQIWADPVNKPGYSLPLSDQTIIDDIQKTTRDRRPYWIRITVKNGDAVQAYMIDDIDITGDVLDRIYIQEEPVG